MSNDHDSHDSDLLDYPHYPGSRGGETSAEAAAELAPNLGRLHRIVREAIAEAGLHGRTADEIGERTGINRYTVRARTAELRKQRVIGDSCMRRLNDSGRRAIVWVLQEHLPELGR
jgi:DNA-directed RNA polymerase specialized sigma24 family protein